MASPQSYVNVSRRPPDIEDYIDMLRRYRSWIIGPMFAGLVLSVVVAFMWPDTYISQAVMRITPQQVPENLIPSVVNTQMAERLNQMQQEILSRTSLQELIQRPSLDLYKRERQRLPLEDIIQDMRNRAIKIQMMEAPSGERRFASAFLIQFSYTDRYKAQAVVRELVTKFTEQNVTVQRNQATLTTSFLNDELKSAKDSLDRLDVEILKFKSENQGRLPEQLPANIQALQGLRMELNQMNEAINRDNQEKMFQESTLQSLKNQASFISNNLEDTVTNQTTAVKNERLIRLNQAIQDAKSNLAGLRQSFTDDYPDIKTFQARLAALEKERDDLEKQEIERAASAPAPEPTTRKVSNPQMQKSLQDVQAQLSATQVRIQATTMDVEERTRQKAEVEKQLVAIQSRIEMSPPLEQQYAGLLRDYDLAKQNYQEMAKRREASETAQNLEEHKAGQNLEVLDPASLPEAPSEPNRLAIAGVGTMLGLMAGIVLAGAREVKNTSLKNLKDVRAYTNLPVLSSIPLLENALLVRRKRRLFWLAWSSAVIIGSIAMSGSAYYYYFGHA
ncbi:MAG: GNVR domain-containing protein [Bryobacteraceae bacterium]|jgi:polysaccharide chain length determinant protein (PEP-CTERM system associated)